MEKYIIFNTQKRNLAKNVFEQGFYVTLNFAFFGKTREGIRNRVRLEIKKKCEYGQIIKKQSNLALSGIHKLYEICHSYTIKKIEFFNNKPIYLRFSVLELSNLLLY